MSNITFHPAAEREYEEALTEFFAMSPEAAEELEAAFDRTVAAICDDPIVGSAIDEVSRSVAVRDTPYSLIYRIDRAADHVVAVAHSKRLPRSWVDQE